MLSACSVENDWVNDIAYNDIDVITQYGDKFHFDISASASMHHQFISYSISLICKKEGEQSEIHILLRDQPESVYNDPISIFSEITSQDNISLYILGNHFVFVYDNCITTYPTDHELFKGYTELDAVNRFKEILLRQGDGSSVS